MEKSLNFTSSKKWQPCLIGSWGKKMVKFFVSFLHCCMLHCLIASPYILHVDDTFCWSVWCSWCVSSESTWFCATVRNPSVSFFNFPFLKPISGFPISLFLFLWFYSMCLTQDNVILLICKCVDFRDDLLSGVFIVLTMWNLLINFLSFIKEKLGN